MVAPDVSIRRSPSARLTAIEDRLGRVEAVAHEPLAVLTIEDVERLEAKVDALAESIAPVLEMLEQYGPLLEQARQRLERPRFGRR